jgi:hypothetical protein
MHIITVPASVSSDLNWEEQIEEMKRVEGSFFVQLDLGIGAAPFLINDGAVFQALTLALDQFSTQLWSSIQDRCKGVILFRGSLHVLSAIAAAEGELSKVEAANVLGNYLHRLASFLPDEVAIYCLFDNTADFTRGEAAQLLSQERFLHMNLSLEPSNGNRGVLLPPDDQCSEEIIRKLSCVLQEDIRVIPEGRLNELWNGLDELIVFEEAISTQGRRQLMGFEAAGGIVKRFGAEGFEPPTHCSQSSCASQTALCSERE